MDQTQLQQQIALYYSKLPADAQAVFSSMKWMETLKNISTKYGLSGDQIETLGTETTLLLLGIINLEGYVNTLSSELAMPSASMEKMVTEINDSILKPILPTLDQAYENHVTSLVEEKYGSAEKLDERFAKLPKEVQEAISESNYQSTLYKISTDKKLSVEQMGILEEATNKVLLGIIHPDMYEGELKNKLRLPGDTTSEIVSAVNEEILKNIREILKSHWVKSEGSIDDEVPLPPYTDIPTPPVMEKVEPVTKTEVVKEEPLPTLPVVLSKTESGIYGNAGIEVVREVTREEDLAHSIIASKLSTMTKSEPVVSDHSMPKMTPPTPTPVPTSATPSSTKPAHDPYKEAIE